MVGQMWAPESRQIVTFSDLQLRATVWSLVEGKATAYIRNPKLVPPKGISITKNKKFIAIIERREAKDWVSIYHTMGEWKMVNTFEVDTFDAADISWCKEDTSIMVYDSPLDAKILIFSAMTGACLTNMNLQNYSINAKYGDSSLALGIKSVSLSPNQYYAVASFFDTKIRLFNGISFKEIAALDHMT